MGSNYADAIWLPCKNFWPGNNTMSRIVIHGTAAGAKQTARQLATSSDFNDGNTASSHYINDVDGTVYQIVQESDSAWANCCVTGKEAPDGVYPTPGKGDYHLHGLDPNHNYNHDTISIENMKYSKDNSEPLTSAQYSSLVKLVADICRRRNITPTRETLIGHYDLDPVNRAFCPGTFDWLQFRSDVNKALSLGATPDMIATKLSPSGEIADFLDADQFQPAKTQGACGFFSVAIVDAASPVGRPTTKTAAQVVSEAETWYAQYDGSNDISNFDGMNSDQLYRLLGQIGLKYHTLTTDIGQIRAWIKAGFPVIINSIEDSYFDMGLNDTVPYYWSRSGDGLNHIITLTGVVTDGNFLVRDSANVTDLNNPSSLRPGPRTYDAGKMRPLWAVAILMHGQNMPNIQGGVPVSVPSGWTDDGKALHNPVNSYVVIAGFRTVVLNWPGGWEPGNVPIENEHDATPLEKSNPSLGDGHSQLFRLRRLEWQASTGKMFEGWLGQEDQWLDNKYAADTKAIGDFAAQSASYQAQLLEAINNGSISLEEQTAINNVITSVQALMQYKK